MRARHLCIIDDSHHRLVSIWLSFEGSLVSRCSHHHPLFIIAFDNDDIVEDTSHGQQQTRTTAARIRCIDTADESGYRTRAHIALFKSTNEGAKAENGDRVRVCAIDIHYACLYMMIEERKRESDSLQSHSFVLLLLHVCARESEGTHSSE